MLKIKPTHIPLEIASDVKTLKEELANMYTHGAGIILFLILAPFLLFKANQLVDNYYLIGCSIFSISLLMVYTSSTLYHAAYSIKLRKRLRIIDHVCIYFLIAGSYTPFLLTHFRDETGRNILIGLWTTVLIGSIFKLFFTHRFKIVSTLAYVGMGWTALLIINPLYERVSTPCIVLIGVGGAMYTIGVIFYLWDKLYHNHLIWHLFVLAGSIAHFGAVWLIL